MDMDGIGLVIFKELTILFAVWYVTILKIYHMWVFLRHQWHIGVLQWLEPVKTLKIHTFDPAIELIGIYPKVNTGQMEN